MLSTLNDLVRVGKVQYVGVSNFSGWQLMKSLSIAEKYGYPRYVVNQTYYSLVGGDYEWELMLLGLDQGVCAMVWSSLGWGRLSRKIRRGQPLPEKSRVHETADVGPPLDNNQLYNVLDEIAEETGKTIPQITINWLLYRPTVSSVIIGARKEEQLQDNLGAVGWKLSPEQVSRMDAVSSVTAAYPSWPYQRQDGFNQLNPPPV